MVVNVCPAGKTSASPDRVWRVLTTVENFGEWQDARYVSGAVAPGQSILLSARGFGRTWPVRIDVHGMDPAHRWIDWVAHLPFGVRNEQRTTLTETPDGGTLVRFN